MSDKKEKQAQAWEAWTNTLTSKAKAALQRKEPGPLPVEITPRDDDDETDAYARFRASLTSKGQEWLDEGVDTEPKPDEEIDTSVARWGLIEAPDAEWATMRLFKSPEGLARRIASLEGQDMVVAAFFGLPLQLTKGPQRYLILPGGQQAIMLPAYEGGPCKMVATETLEGEIQDDGFLGPPELANTLLVSNKLDKSAQPVAQGDDDEEDDDV